MLTPAPGILPRISRAILRLLGWKTICQVDIPPKAVLIAYPHTSNWDFLFTMLGKSALGLHAHWVGKDSLFCWPVAGLLRSMGGIPVNRRQRSGFVEHMAEEFARHPQFHLAIAPEGTRKRTEGWKSGFYRIALAAKVPLALACSDYARREVGIIAVLHPSGDPDADMAAIASAYAGCTGRIPQFASPITLLGQGGTTMAEKPPGDTGHHPI